MPKAWTLKCNINATIFQEQGQYGIWMCLRDDKGDFVAAKPSWLKGLPQPQ